MVWGFYVYFVYMIPLETDVLRKHRFQKVSGLENKLSSLYLSSPVSMLNPVLKKKCRARSADQDPHPFPLCLLVIGILFAC